MKDYEDFPNWAKCFFHYERTMSLRGQRVECNGVNKKPQVAEPLVPVCWGCLGRLWEFAYIAPHLVF